MPTIITGTPIDEIANIVASFSSKLKHKIISFQKFTDSFKAKIYAGKLITVDINAGPRRDKNAVEIVSSLPEWVKYSAWAGLVLPMIGLLFATTPKKIYNLYPFWEQSKNSDIIIALLIILILYLVGHMVWSIFSDEVEKRYLKKIQDATEHLGTTSLPEGSKGIAVNNSHFMLSFLVIGLGIVFGRFCLLGLIVYIVIGLYCLFLGLSGIFSKDPFVVLKGKIWNSCLFVIPTFITVLGFLALLVFVQNLIPTAKSYKESLEEYLKEAQKTVEEIHRNLTGSKKIKTASEAEEFFQSFNKKFFGDKIPENFLVLEKKIIDNMNSEKETFRCAARDWAWAIVKHHFITMVVPEVRKPFPTAYKEHCNYEQQNLKVLSGIGRSFMNGLNEKVLSILILFVPALLMILLYTGSLNHFRYACSAKKEINQFSQIEKYFTKTKLKFRQKILISLGVYFTFFIIVPINFILFWFSAEVLYYTFTGLFISKLSIVEIFSWVPTAFVGLGLPLIAGRLFLLALFFYPLFVFFSFFFWLATQIWNKLKIKRELRVPEVEEILNELCIKANVRKPKLVFGSIKEFNISVGYTNFFELHPRIIISKGAYYVLNKDEIKSLLAHEIAHLKYDIKWINFTRYLAYFTLTPPSFLSLPFDLYAAEVRADEFAVSLVGTSEHLISAFKKIQALEKSKIQDRCEEKEAKGTLRKRWNNVKEGIKIMYEFTYGRGLLSYVHPPFEQRIDLLEKLNIATQ